MSVEELNPNHPATQAFREHWQKLAVALVAKMGGHVIIDSHDLDRISPSACITLMENHEGLHLRIVDEATAARLAREHGGLPN